MEGNITVFIMMRSIRKGCLVAGAWCREFFFLIYASPNNLVAATYAKALAARGHRDFS